MDVGEFLRTYQDVVAIGKVHDAQKRGAWDVAGQAANIAALQVKFEGIAKTLVHESDVLVIGREVGALAKMREDFNVRRQRVDGAALFSLGQQDA